MLKSYAKFEIQVKYCTYLHKIVYKNLPFKKKNCTFALNMTSHASRWISAPGEVFEFYIIALIGLADKTDYTKRPLTLAEQVAKLKQRGLVFDDENEAIAYLFNISYYRLRAYTYPFQENGEGSEHNFTRQDIHFKDIIDLYCFDRRLRSLIFNAIEKIEVANHPEQIVKFKLDKEVYKDDINVSKFSVHELLTLASIVELEGANSEDRAGVAGVFYNRIEAGWTLGSDATTYYAVNKDFTKDLTNNNLKSCNKYNTRSENTCAFTGLPIGPIDSPSLNSINAVMEPEEHDYYYFVADKNKKTYFAKTYKEHTQTVSQLRKDGLWYEY